MPGEISTVIVWSESTEAILYADDRARRDISVLPLNATRPTTLNELLITPLLQLGHLFNFFLRNT